MQAQTLEGKKPKIIAEFSLCDLGEFKDCPRRDEIRVKVLSILVDDDSYGSKCLMGVFECESGKEPAAAEWDLECSVKIFSASCTVSEKEVRHPSCELPIKLFHRSEVVLKPEENYLHF